ncbi:UvrD-helicase domain-containing protein [Sulfitobacter sp. 1A13353]|uniref:UvrD-helicase domain-containing protein n=1 Tax=Sulfitobacter sp. 1A13353 TaxID=3368568 RepID=UPI0037461C54
MNIEAPNIPPHRARHIELCEQVKTGETSISKLVDELRGSLEGHRLADQFRYMRKIAARERKVFEKRAAAAIDRNLKPNDEGIPASALEANMGLLHFASLISPNIRLRARAGSGKSTALVIKCDFLINEIGIPPEAIQILTFNRAAADSLSGKLCDALGKDVGKKIGVNTFHSLASHVLQRYPETQRMTLKFKDEDRSEGEILSDLRKSVLKVSMPRDYDAYRTRYYQSDFSYVARWPNFEDFIRAQSAKATTLYRARQGGPTPVRPSPISRHLERIAEDYEDRLRSTSTIDGEAGLREAASILKSGAELPGFKRVTGGLQFLFVDEFQDFSPAFSKLTQGVMARNPHCVLNAVGDDWQSINAFMGADLTYFESLKNTYPATLNLPLQTNWRCGKRIVELGNLVMTAPEGKEAVAGLPHEGRVRVHEGGIEKTFSNDDWHPKARDYLARHIDRMAQAAWADDARAKRKPGKIAILASSNEPFGLGLGAYAQLIDKSDGGVVQWSTAHSSKGVEWDHVILIDAIATLYPVNHPASPISTDMISQADLEAEAQRLLYVAVTRAKHSLAILAPTELHPLLVSAKELAKR